MQRQAWIQILGAEIDNVFCAAVTSDKKFIVENFTGKPGIYTIKGDLFKEGVTQLLKAEYKGNSNGEFAVLESTQNKSPELSL